MQNFFIVIITACIVVCAILALSVTDYTATVWHNKWKTSYI